MTRDRRPERLLLALSLTGNALSGLAAVAVLRRAGGLRAVLQRRRRDAGTPFPPAPPGTTVFAGDSHVEQAPLLEMLTPYRQCGVGGQTVVEVAQWLPGVVGPEVGRVVLSAGSNDVLQGAPPAQVLRRYAALLDGLPPSVPVVVLGLPPLAGHEVVAQAVDRGLRDLAVARGLDFVPLVTRGGGDGVHLTQSDYLRLGAALSRWTASDGAPPAQ